MYRHSVLVMRLGLASLSLSSLGWRPDRVSTTHWKLELSSFYNWHMLDMDRMRCVKSSKR